MKSALRGGGRGFQNGLNKGGWVANSGVKNRYVDIVCGWSLVAGAVEEDVDGGPCGEQEVGDEGADLDPPRPLVRDLLADQRPHQLQ